MNDGESTLTYCCVRQLPRPELYALRPAPYLPIEFGRLGLSLRRLCGGLRNGGNCESPIPDDNDGARR